jgi:hypothetical protein
VLRALVPRLGAFEALLDYGEQRAHALARERGLDWKMMSEHERDEFIDRLLHEDEA